MSNIPSNQQVARLRELHAKIMKGETAFVGSALQDAANEIERQHAALTGERGPTETKSEVEHLRDALGTVRKYLEGTSMATWIDGFFNGKPPKYSAHDYERVIAAGGNGWSTLERLRDMAMENHGFAHETQTRLPGWKSVDAFKLARQFHEVYERLAPSFGYETRKETRAFDPHSPNGRLMIAVCRELIEPPAVETNGNPWVEEGICTTHGRWTRRSGHGCPGCNGEVEKYPENGS